MRHPAAVPDDVDDSKAQPRHPLQQVGVRGVLGGIHHHTATDLGDRVVQRAEEIGQATDLRLIGGSDPSRRHQGHESLPVDTGATTIGLSAMYGNTSPATESSLPMGDDVCVTAVIDS